MKRVALAILLAGASLVMIAQPAHAQALRCDIRPEGTTCIYVVDTPIIYEGGALGLPTVCMVWPYPLFCV